MTNYGAVRSPEIPKEMRITIGSWDDYWAYAERLSDCSEFIKELGCGSHDFSMIKKSRAGIPASQFARAVAEWGAEGKIYLVRHASKRQNSSGRGRPRKMS
jgi:hypothetical protein